MERNSKHGWIKLTPNSKLSKVIVIPVLVGIIINVLPYNGNDADTTDLVSRFPGMPRRSGKTYKTPVPKTMKTPNFLLPLTWSFHTDGAGMRSRAKSVMILQYP